jgi:hypothetical protein
VYPDEGLKPFGDEREIRVIECHEALTTRN